MLRNNGRQFCTARSLLLVFLITVVSLVVFYCIGSSEVFGEIDLVREEGLKKTPAEYQAELDRLDGTRNSSPFDKNCTRRGVALPLVSGSHGDERKNGEFPLIIHRMWKTDVVPEGWREGASSCREFNPDHLYCHWTDSELDR
jgi:hypothetical protein